MSAVPFDRSLPVHLRHDLPSLHRPVPRCLESTVMKLFEQSEPSSDTLKLPSVIKDR